MFDLVMRTVTEVGEDVAAPGWNGEIISNYYQMLTLNCGHRERAMVDLAAWRVGADCYCSQCEALKKEFRAEIMAELKRKVDPIFS